MAETVYKAKKPFKQDGKHYYPITTHDQIIMPDGNRWDGQHLSSDVRDEATEVGSIKVNADLLGGKLPEYYKNATTLGGIAASGYALKTDTALDSAKLGGKAPEYYLQPRNLLDNSDFSNLIAQAGLNGAHGSTAYIADRWISLAASATQQNGYTTLSTTEKSGRISQKLPDALAGKTVTAAAKVSGNSIVYCGIYYIQNSVSKSIAVHVSAPNGIMMKSGTIPSDATDVEFRIYIAYTDGGGSCNVYQAALYEGSYTADTLPPYVPKGYAAELAECQRYYYQSYSGSSAAVTSGMIVCEAITTNKATNVFFPQPMRIEKPTVTLYSPFSGNVNKATEYVSETEVDAKAGHRSRYRFMLQNDASAFEIGKHYCIHYTVSADL